MGKNKKKSPGGSFLEIERKFLVHRELLPPLEHGCDIVQAYIFCKNTKELRIRILKDTSFLTLKCHSYKCAREEFEYEIPLEEGKRIIQVGALYPPLEKTRYKVSYENKDWEIDIFKGAQEGLILAELELAFENEEFPKPSWVGKEVTGEKKYYNAHLYTASFVP